MKEGNRYFRAIVWGYALLLVFFGLFTGRVNLLFFGENVQVTFSYYAHAAEIGQVCCLVFAAILSFWRRSVAEKIVPHAALVLLVAGYALTLYQAIGVGLPLWLSVVAGALFGAGQGACFLCWFVVYARLTTGEVVRVMVASTMLSGVILLGVGLLPDTVMLFSVLSVVVAACCALTYYCLGVVTEQVEEKARERDRAEGGRLDDGRRFWSWLFLERRSLLCLVAIALCVARSVISLKDSFFAPIGCAIPFLRWATSVARRFLGYGQVFGREEQLLWHLFRVACGRGNVRCALRFKAWKCRPFCTRLTT